LNHKNKKWDKHESEWATKMNKWKIKDMRELLNKLDNDPDTEKRKERQICKYCHYNIRMALQAFTDTQCGKCDTPMTFSNSDTGILCKRCATMFESCTHCGGEMD
jgi:hypothetical protein